MSDEISLDDRVSAIQSQFAAIEVDIAEIKSTLDFIKETIVKADAGIANIAGQVMPTIEELKKSPFLKMLGVK